MAENITYRGETIKYLTSNEVADRLRITKEHVARLVREGKLFALRIGSGRKLLIPEGEIDRVLRPAVSNDDTQRK